MFPRITIKSGLLVGMVRKMAVTTTQIRDLLNRPRGLNEGTISEYITLRTNEVTKIARSSTLYGVASANAVTTDLKEGAIKFLVCVDCLTVMIDTIPSYYTAEDEQKINDQRFREQLSFFKKRADEAVGIVAGGKGAAFYLDSTDTRVEGGSDTLRS